MLTREPLILVVSGPSGVGKGTVIDRMMEGRDDLFKSISCTTRAPRVPHETDGVHYHFVSAERFQQMLDTDDLLEWAGVHGKTLYGTPKGPVDEALAAGRDVILEIDFQGARTIRQKLGNRAVLVFIAPPSWETLAARLRGRDTENPDAVARRLRTALREIANIGLFQYVIVNEQGREVQAAAALSAILDAERARLTRNDWQDLQSRLLQEAEEPGQ
jgi:guanylate kinase